MNCPSCNVEVESGSAYCPKCGKRVDEDASVGARITAAGAGDARRDPSDRFREQLTTPSGNADDDDREIPLWEGGYSPKAMFSWWFGAAVLTVILAIGLIFFFAIVPVAIAIGVAIVLAWLWPACTLLYRRMALRYRLTSQRFIHEHGVLTRVTDRIEVIDVDDVSYKQTLIDRMVNVGTIRIESGDRTHPSLVLHGIADVERVYDLIDDARRKERVRRGIHIAHAGSEGGI